MKYWMNIWFVILAAVSSLSIFLFPPSLTVDTMLPRDNRVHLVGTLSQLLVLPPIGIAPFLPALPCVSSPPPHNNGRGNPWVGFPGGSVVKNPPANARHAGSVPGLRRSPGKGNDNPLQYFCLGNPLDRGACQATAHGVQKELDTTQQLSNTTNS